MKNYPHPIIAREGWPFLTVSLVVALGTSWFWGGWSIPFWILYFFILQFFRDPPREIPQGEGLVLCPADGRVLVVGNARDPYRDCDSVKISVFMNVFNVHSNRAPVDAVVKEVVYNKGFFVNASFDKASLGNERNALVLQTNEGVTLSCVQVAGLVARRILCYVKPGEYLKRGQRYGFIRFGSRVDVYLPPGSRPRVAIGDKVKATSTVLAELPRA
ncbi:MAG TPA: phosphatidylserine decarboxylase [Usitatibacter sp.]|jgi:phosphatidylserine decarboxylase|nr:phosphatidylserine decarboxylase [Usitatibacter sp.]